MATVEAVRQTQRLLRPSPNEAERALAEERKRQRLQRMKEVRARSREFESLMTRAYKCAAVRGDEITVEQARRQWQIAHDDKIRQLVERLSTAQTDVGEAAELAAKAAAEASAVRADRTKEHLAMLQTAQERYVAAMEELAEKENAARTAEIERTALREKTATCEKTRAKLVAARHRVRMSALAEYARAANATDPTQPRDVPAPTHYAAHDERGLWLRRRNNQDVPLGLVHVEGCGDVRAHKAMVDAEREIARIRALQAASDAERIAEDLKRQERGDAAFARHRLEMEAKQIVADLATLTRTERQLRQDEAVNGHGSAPLAGAAAQRRAEEEIERAFEQPERGSISLLAAKQPSSDGASQAKHPHSAFVAADDVTGDVAHSDGEEHEARRVNVHWRSDSRLAVVHSPTHTRPEQEVLLPATRHAYAFDPRKRREGLEPVLPVERLEKKLAQILGLEQVPWATDDHVTAAEPRHM